MVELSVSCYSPSSSVFFLLFFSFLFLLAVSSTIVDIVGPSSIAN